jgi:hypothetical protein
MSNVVDMHRPTGPGHRDNPAPTPSHGRETRTPNRWRFVRAILTVEVLFLVGLVLAVPIGLAAVAFTIALGFVLAALVRARLDA